jgi:mannose-6-phosphate isomerase-like protein (cupin superfamily)
MIIRTLDKSIMKPAHGGTILAQPGLGGEEISAPFSSAWGCLKPGMQQAPEKVEVSKLYFIVEGIAEMCIEDESRRLGKGDLLFIPAGSMHTIRNAGTGDLVTFAIWWHPPEGGT